MSPTDRTSLRQKLLFLRQALEELHEYAQTSEQDFLANKQLRAAVERQMQIAIESVIDCARLFVTLKGWRRVREDTDAIRILPRHGLLTAEHAGRLIDAKKFRNVLVHQYAEVIPAMVYRHLTEDLKDLDAFAQAMEGRLREEEVV